MLNTTATTTHLANISPFDPKKLVPRCFCLQTVFSCKTEDKGWKTKFYDM